jgi:hypothetical protein
METYILKIKGTINLKESKEEYINECCQYCDVILHLIKPEITNIFQIDNIEIEQEDWGWYLFFIKNNLHYNLNISFNDEEPKSNEFVFYYFVNKVEKKFIFSKNVEVEEETKMFGDKIKAILNNYGTISKSE